MSLKIFLVERQIAKPERCERLIAVVVAEDTDQAKEIMGRCEGAIWKIRIIGDALPTLSSQLVLRAREHVPLTPQPN